MQSARLSRNVFWGLALIAAGLLLLAGDFHVVLWPLRALMGPLALAIPGLIFAAVYAGNREQWWAIIPAGLMLTLAGVALVDAVLPRVSTGWLFFCGLAVTFGLVWRETGGVQRWARAVALLCLGMTALLLLGSLLRYALPLALVAAGLYLLAGRSREE
ncbi:MAG: hypothetical protein DIU55_007555 [Bacillota bacterium]|nr:MAG: hypothetical protein DIU55_08470 [Bacillota bacterium]